MNTRKLAIACILCLCICMVAMPAIAQENGTAANATNVTNVTVTATPVIEQIAAETATPTPTEAKFRTGPTVTLRPVTDIIDKSQDGLVELYMYNPTVNDVTLTADVQVSVPSGIHVYGAGFGSGSAAGTVAGTFTVPPGTTRTININIKAERTGPFTVHFTGLYWPGDDKDAFQQISLTHPLTVKEPSPNPTDPKPTAEGGMKELPYTYIIVGCLAVITIVFIAMMLKKPPKTEVVIEEE